MFEKLLLYDNQQPRLPALAIVRFIDYPKGVLIEFILLGNGESSYLRTKI